MLVGECDMCFLLEHIFHSANLLVYIKNTLDFYGSLLHMSFEETTIFLKVFVSVTTGLCHSFRLLVLRVCSSLLRPSGETHSLLLLPSNQIKVIVVGMRKRASSRPVDYTLSRILG